MKRALLLFAQRNNGLGSGDIVSCITLDEVHAAVVAFLDQFIERGARPDILDLRQRLASDAHARQLLDAQMPNTSPTEREAFDGMRSFFAVEAEGAEFTAGPPNLVVLVSWTGWDDWADEKTTNDPAQWHDWLAAVRDASPR
jgi:hypothetical protein